jgi:hypothetical protein
LGLRNGVLPSRSDCVSRSRGGMAKAGVGGEREADERMAAVWESLARMREKQLKEGTTRPV